jgi:hypothetical protein
MTYSEAIGYLKTLKNRIPLKFFTNNGAKRYDEFCEKSISALEKQKPNKVKEYGICPKCNHDFGMEKVNYCPNCGQKLDWR